MKRILIFVLLLLFFIGSVSATENLTEISSESYTTDTVKYHDIYVDSSKEVDGDGLSPETAYTNLEDYGKYENLENDGVIHLAKGNYNLLGQNGNYTVTGQGDDTTIRDLWFTTTTYKDHGDHITFVNLTLDIVNKHDVLRTIWINEGASYEESVEFNSISLEGTNFRFVNCTFINSSIVAGQYMNSINYQNPEMDVTVKSFENCRFINYSYNTTVNEYYKKIGFNNIRCCEFESPNLITSYQYTKFIFKDCIFENNSAECIAYSNGGLMGTNGVYGEILFDKCSFTNNTVKGIIKANQISNCNIVDCTYDFNATTNINDKSPFYINKTDVPLNKTHLTIKIKDDTLIITLTDVNANKPISNVEVGIFRDGKVFKYEDTDANGQIILKDLEGTYNFEISYPGDPYSYLPASINKTFTFVKNEVKKEDTTTKKVVKKATKITAKAKTFKVKKTKKYSITLKSGKKALSKVKVTIKVGKKTYSAKTNTKGKATFNLKKLTKKGKYTAVIKFAGNKNFKATTKKVKITVKK